MGNKEVKLDHDDIIVDDHRYPGTPGLWGLVTGTK